MAVAFLLESWAHQIIPAVHLVSATTLHTSVKKAAEQSKYCQCVKPNNSRTYMWWLNPFTHYLLGVRKWNLNPAVHKDCSPRDLSGYVTYPEVILKKRHVYIMLKKAASASSSSSGSHSSSSSSISTKCIVNTLLSIWYIFGILCVDVRSL